MFVSRIMLRCCLGFLSGSNRACVVYPFSVALLHEKRLMYKKETQLFLVAEYRCVKISVALLRQFFSIFLCVFEKFYICVRKSVLRGCFSFFHLFFSKFNNGRIEMCENQCCVVASVFFVFFLL